MTRKYEWLLEIIEHRRNDLTSRLIRFGLFLLSIVYRLGIRIRNWAFDHRIFNVHQIDVPVISIGNLTVGGTGKTPIAIWLARYLCREYKVAIVSRGYGSQNGQLNDEGHEISQSVPNAIQVQNRDRVLGAQKAKRLMAADDKRTQPPVILLDDGFQHRRLARDLDVVLIDATQPFGHRHLIPGGLLREPLSAIRRADVAVLTRANLVSASERSTIQSEIFDINPELVWAETQLKPTGWLTQDGTIFPYTKMKNKNIFAFCGIGNPTNFFTMLTNDSFELTHTATFPDHHDYSQAELIQLVDQASELQCEAIVCTKKDFVKIDRHFDFSIPTFALLTEIQFTDGEDQFINSIKESLLKHYRN